MKATKIVATIGPGSESEETLSRMMSAGMNVMRLNMSHGNHAWHRTCIERGRSAANKLGLPIAILLDLAGPKIRTGTFETERITLVAGEKVTLTTQDIVGNARRIYINYEKLPQEVEVGAIIMIDDGRTRVVVDSIESTEIHCTIITGGELKPRRGVNIPGASLSIETITKKDKEDLAFGLESGVDMVGISFVRRPSDIEYLKQMLKDSGKPDIPVIAKIETVEAINGLDEIVAATDALMVARGDLAVEISAEEVPHWQKEIIRRANIAGKPVITATQMMESMIRNSTPTRAEISDVANAILDGTDAVMLSEESALGLYPVEAVEALARVARASEADREDKDRPSDTIPHAVTTAVAHAAHDLKAKAIVALTETGATARMVARFRPACPIVAITPNEATKRALAMSRGVHAFTSTNHSTLDENLRFIPAFLQKHGFAEQGDTILVAAGLRFGITGSTNTLVAITIQ